MVKSLTLFSKSSSLIYSKLRRTTILLSDLDLKTGIFIQNLKFLFQNPKRVILHRNGGEERRISKIFRGIWRH